MEISLRRILPVDVPVLSKIAQQTFFDTFTGTCTEADMQFFLHEYLNEERLAVEIAQEKNFYFFAEINNQPIAYIQFMEDYTSFPMMKKWKALELKRIYVLEEYLGKGIAQKLLDFILEHAHQNQYEVVWLGVWEKNYRAQKFYEKYGFIDSGHTHDFPIGNTPQTDKWLWKFL